MLGRLGGPRHHNSPSSALERSHAPSHLDKDQRSGSHLRNRLSNKLFSLRNVKSMKENRYRLEEPRGSVHMHAPLFERLSHPYIHELFHRTCSRGVSWGWPFATT